MARFKYLGEPTKPQVVAYGPTVAIVFHLSNGAKFRHDATDKKNGFTKGADIGLDVTDPRVLRHLRNDDRFQEIP